MRTNFRFGPLALTTTNTTNILNPGTTTGGVNSTSAPYANLKILIRKIRFVNKTTSAATFRLYLGGTAGNVAGTELWFDKNVAANDSFEWPCYLILSTSDFLVGGSNTATAITIEGEGEIGVAF